MSRSRSSIASMYAGSTAPISTRTRPQRRTASVRSAAGSANRTASGRSRPVIAAVSAAVSGAGVSDIDDAAFLDGLEDRLHGRIAEEDLERDDRLRSGRGAGSISQPGVADDEVRVRRDLADRGVLDGDRVLLQGLAKLCGQHHAAAHSGVAGHDDLVYVGCADGGHGAHASPAALSPTNAVSCARTGSAGRARGS